MKQVLFGINQNLDKDIENKILTAYKNKYQKEFLFDSDCYGVGLIKQLNNKQYDILILKEDIEETHRITIEFLDYILQKFEDLQIIFIIHDRHRGKDFVYQLYKMGIYDILFLKDYIPKNVAQLIENPRNKKEAFLYLNLEEQDKDDFQTNFEKIPKEKLQEILHRFKEASPYTISQIFDELNQVYNEKQMIFLVTLLPPRIKEKLMKSQNQAYRDYYQYLLTLGEKYKEKENSFSQNKERVRAEGKTKVVTKIEKEYIHSIPSDYNKVVAFVGGGKTGTTTIVDRIAKQFNHHNRKVAVIDLSQKKTLYYMKCWGSTELSEEQKRGLENLSNGFNIPIDIDHHYHLYTQIEEETEQFDFYNAVEQIRYDHDIILLDMDFHIKTDWLKHGIHAIYLVQDLNILDMIDVKQYLKEIKKLGVNMKKIFLVLNKYLPCRVKLEDVFTMLTEPIPFLEEDKEENYLEINSKMFRVSFDLENYKKLLNSYMYTFDHISMTEGFNKQIQEICYHIYPIEKNSKFSKWFFKKMKR